MRPRLAKKIDERKETRERAKPLLALIEHACGSLPTDNCKRALLSAIRRKTFELEHRFRLKKEFRKTSGVDSASD